MRLSKIVTLLLAGFFTFGTLNSVAATKHTKKAIVVQASKKTPKKIEFKAKKNAVKKKTISLTEKHKNTSRKYYQSGVASYYSDQFNGRRTANGERFNNSAMTAAHRSLPFGTLIEVTNVRNGKKVVVRVNDRGPYAHARVLDLSKSAAQQLGMHHSGVAQVKVSVLDKNTHTELVNEKS